MNRLLIGVIVVFIFQTCIFCQLHGSVKDEFGVPLASASVYIKGTTLGTTTNINGMYTLNLPKGKSEIVFQYIGYKQKIETIENHGRAIALDMILTEQSYELSEIQIKSGVEDPAYAIIRNAINKRQYYKDKIESYSVNVYIKGNQKILKIPEKVFGQKVGNMEGILDTNRQGIIYLSESVSKFHYKAPASIKEELISSKTSGNNKGFTYNRAREMQFSIYSPTINFFKEIISPIGPGALLYYKYRLEGSYFDKEGNEINKIKVIPRNESTPVFRGFIYIYEHSWSVHSVELAITGKSINQEILDTLWLKQQYIPGPAQDQWLLQSQNLDFVVNFLGIKLKGYFTAVYNDYEVNRTFSEGFFSNEVLHIEKESNKKTDTYWDTIRPVPLLKEEIADFKRKDSLQLIWESKSFRDSMDKVDNKFSFENILFGYTYHNSFKSWSIGYGSPLTTLEFDPVKGFYTALRMEYRKNKDDDRTSWFKLNPEISYGFSDKNFRGNIQIENQFNRNNYKTLSISGGIKTVQFNENNPISSVVSELYNLYDKKNYLKQYEKQFVNLEWSQYLFPSFKTGFAVEIANRNILENTTNYSLRKKAEIYSVNYPGDTIPFSFEKHTAYSFSTGISFWPGQKYVSYPDFRIYLSSKYPRFSLNYKVNRVVYNSNSKKPAYTVHNLKLGMLYSFKPRFVGESNLSVSIGELFGNNIEFMDYIHFNGNQTLIASPLGALNSFKLLPYYDHSTSDSYLEGHFLHNFQGFFLNKIPLIKELKFEEIVVINYLGQKNDFQYTELSFGLSNVGWGLFRIFKIEYTWSYNNTHALKQGLTIGIGL
ncbi:MAG TPA: DUF5686 and carboxypeptidase regulatory-like domain-containing protein [Saprospiraceae bacterium]|nr:DUF5686 and carboxypeptidase regulatory-like domain-containing protein [Saprospiraceae bacterium]